MEHRPSDASDERGSIRQLAGWMAQVATIDDFLIGAPRDRDSPVTGKVRLMIDDAVTSRRYRPVLFFSAVYLLSWIPWFIGIWVGSQEGMAASTMIFMLVGLLPLPGMALFLVLNSRDPVLRYDFRDRLFDLRRIRLGDVFLAIALPFAVVLTSVGLSLLFGESSDQFAIGGGASLLPLIVLTLILAPIAEETGWHGYGVDSLRAFNGMLKATLLYGILWSLWHAPLLWLGGSYHHHLLQMGNPIFIINFFVSVIPASIILNWFYYRNNRSITFAILTHSMYNGAAVFVAAGQVAKCIATVVWAVVAIGIIARDRTFREGPRDFVDARTPAAK